MILKFSTLDYKWIINVRQNCGIGGKLIKSA